MKNFLSIKEFSDLSGIGQKALRHWDAIGLFAPAYRDQDTGYRYYSPDQIISVKFITILSSLNIPLKTLIDERTERTPETLRMLLEERERLLDMEMRYVREKYSIIHTRLQLIRLGEKVQDAGMPDVCVSRMWAIPFILGGRNEYRENESFLNPFIRFCREAHKRRINLNFPVAARHENMDAFLSDPGRPEYFLSLDPTGNQICPAGNYLSGFTRGHYGMLGDLPEKITAYMREKGLAVSGPVYTTYLHDELCLEDPLQYLVHVCVAVA